MVDIINPGTVIGCKKWEVIVSDDYGQIAANNNYIRLQKKYYYKKGIHCIKRIRRRISVKKGKYTIKEILLRITEEETDLCDMLIGLCKAGYKTSIAFYRVKDFLDTLNGK